MLTVHRAERADRLVEALGRVLATPPEDPFEPEVIAVPTRGVERWLAQQLSSVLGVSPGRADGVCANVELPFPGVLVGNAVAAATGVERENDPWRPERAVWPLLDVVEAHLHEPWLAVLSRHLGGGEDDDRRDRRFATVRHLADLFDRYAVHRPALLRAWAEGAAVDDAGDPLPADAAWQARLWRELRGRIGMASPAERLADACRALRDQPGLVDLPERLSVFGLTRLPASHLEVLHAIAVARDVHLFLLHPSPALWERVAQRAHGELPRRADDPTADLPRNRLLASWGRDARESQLVLAAGPGARAVEHHPLVEEPTTLLGLLQADIRNDRVPPGAPRPGEPDRRLPLGEQDRSVQVHACHGRARQVEVLRDALLHLFADDETLEPRDVIVMCPDIDAFAPLITATFDRSAATRDEDDFETSPPLDAPGASSGQPTTSGDQADLRVRLADRSLRQTNPVLGVVGSLLDLAGARVTASQVLGLASLGPVRKRFGFDDDDIARIEEWVAVAGVRWGLHAEHRAGWRLDRVTTGTWRAGIDRLLVGVARSEDDLELVGGVLPVDDVGPGDIDLVGRLAEMVDRVEAAVRGLSHAQPLPSWTTSIAEAADALTATTEAEAWQRAQLARVLQDVLDEAGSGTAEGTGGAGAEGAVLSPSELRALLAERLRGRPTRASFRTGHLTMCTLVPMRSVPHRVVCLIGLDDGAFPRRSSPDGDDLLAAAPRVGDRDARSEDRQLLLDALLAAGQTLVVTYTGRDERTNAVAPPAVPVGELLDAVDATVRVDGTSADGAPMRAREHVVVAHPLQPFDSRAFVAGRLRRETPWSFDVVARDGAVRAAAPRESRPAFLDDVSLPPVDPGVIGLDDLVRLLQTPVKGFLRQRLGITLGRPDDAPADALPLELDGLQRWGVGERLLAAHLAGTAPDVAVAAERARGTLPPGVLGQAVVADVGPKVDRIVRAAADLVGADAPTSLDVDVTLPDGTVVVGTVPGVVGHVLRTVTYSTLGPKPRLAAWIRLLALTATHPERPLRAVTVMRDRRSAATACVGPLADGANARRAAALHHLGVLVDVYRRGLREPLPLYAKTSAAWAAAPDDEAFATAEREWSTRWSDRTDTPMPGEAEEPEHTLVLGGVKALGDVLGEPRENEAGEGWDASQTTRLGRWAHRLWDGLLACEVTGTR